MGKTKIQVLALLLALVMAVFTGCVAVDEELKQPSNVVGDSGVNGNTQPGGDTAPQESKQEAPSQVTVSETVLYDADGIKVTATGYEDGWMGPEVKLLVENNSSGNVLVTTNALSVNGYMMPLSSLYAEVAAGKKANESLLLMSSELERSGIETVAQLQFYIKVSDSESWDELAVSELLTLTTSAGDYVQSVDDSGDVLFREKGIKVVCKGLKQDLVWDGTIVFYMENNSGKPITVYAENVSVNGFMQDAGLWADLRDGTRLVDGMYLLDLSDLELESIDAVENIEFNLRIINSDSWDEIATTDVLTLNFQ